MESNSPKESINYFPSATTSSIVLFLAKTLPFFRESVDDSQKGDIENLLTQDLCIFLSNKSRVFIFVTQLVSRKVKNRTVDLGVVLRSQPEEKIKTNPIFTIEAKRLPNPSKNKKEEKQYVTGNLGGIARFKRNQHGVDKNGNLLPHNTMIGYVEANNFKYWHEKINSWIEDCCANNPDTDIYWNSTELLQEVSNETKMARYNSKHIRKDGSQLWLDHFFI